MAKGRKKTSDAEKRLRGTDQPCRMDGSVPAVAAPATAQGDEDANQYNNRGMLSLKD